MNGNVSLSRQWTARRRRFGWALMSLIGLVLLAQTALTQGPMVYAIKDARVVTVTQGTLATGTVVFRDGLIEAVGERVTIPEDARIIDGRGLTVYPGLIDAHTDLALEPPAPPSRRGGTAESPPTPPPPQLKLGLNADRLAADQLRPDESRLEKARQVGITAALTIPRSGIILGQSALINLAGDSPSKMIVKSPVALHVSLDRTEGFRTYPGSLMGVISYLRQTLLDAQHYGLEQERYLRIQRGVRRPEPDKAFDALQPVLRRQLPVVFTADEAKDIHRIIMLAEEFNLKSIISGAHDSQPVASLLRDKQIPVLVSLNFPTPPKDADPEADVPLRVLRLRAEAPKTPAALDRAGVKFAFTSGFMSDPKEMMKNVAKAIKAGLPEEAALRAFTLNAAEIFGVAEQLGSIEVGKIANLVVADGNLFEEKTKIKHLFIDGREIELKQAPERPGASDEQPAVNASGTWQLTVESPQGTIPVTATLRQSGTTITGTLSSMFGQTATDGSVRGARVRFKTLVDVQGQSLEVEFEGTIEGDTMTGSVSVQGQGVFPFTGTRPGKGV